MEYSKSAKSSGPEDVLLAALTYRERFEFDRVASCCDETTAASFFREYCEAVRPPTKEDYQRDYPHLSAKALAARFPPGAADPPPDPQIARAVAGIETYAQLVALTPMDFLRRWLEADDLRYEIMRQLRARGHDIPSALLQAAPGTRYECLPAERTGDRSARAFYRMVFDDGAVVRHGAIEHEDLQRGADGGWRLIVRPHLLQARGPAAFVIPPEIARLLGR
jgi:hypothetical protein